MIASAMRARICATLSANVRSEVSSHRPRRGVSARRAWSRAGMVTASG